MSVPLSTLIQSTVISITFFLCLLSFAYWFTRRDDITLYWLAVWLGLGTIFAAFRLMQYFHMNDAMDVIVPKALMTTTFLVAWVGYRMGNAMAKVQPPTWERVVLLLGTAVLILVLWTTDLIMTRQIVTRVVPLGGTFHGLGPGPIYPVTSLLALGIGFIPPLRLLQAKSVPKSEAIMLAFGFFIVIFFALVDFISVYLNKSWIRLSDFSYLPMGILFSFIQVRHYGQLYSDMDGQVRKRTEELHKANLALRSEIRKQKKTDEVRQQVVLRYQALFEQTHDAVLIFDLKGRILDVNKRTGEMLGYSPENMRGLAYAELPGDYKFINKIIKRLLAGERVPPFERLQKKKDGSLIQVEVIAELVHDPHGKPMHIQSVVRDITERKDAERERLQKTNEMLALAEVSRQISSSLRLGDVLERIAGYAQELLKGETSAVYLFEPSTQTFHAVSAVGVDQEDIRQDSLKIGEGILGNIALNKTGEIVADTAHDPRGVKIAGTEIVPQEHLIGVPVFSEDQMAGLIAVWRTGEEQNFTTSELDFLTNMAGQVSIAIKNARLFEETRKRLREMEGVAQVSEALSRTMDLDSQLKNILEAVIHAIPVAERGTFLLADDDGNLTIRAAYGYKDPRVRGYRFSPNTGYSSLAFRERRPFLIKDAHAEPTTRYEGDIPEMRSVGSALVAPLIVKDIPVGVISIDSSGPECLFTQEDLHLLTVVTGSAAIAIENASLFENLRQRLSITEGVNSISSALRSAETLGEALPILLEHLMKLLNVKGASLELVDSKSGEIVTELAQGDWEPVTGLHTPPGSGITGQVLASGKPYSTRDVIAEGKSVRPDLFGNLTAVAVVPVVSQHQPIGALWVGRETSIQPEEVNLLAAVGEMVGNAIHRMMLHEQSEQLLHDLQVSHQDLSYAYETTLEGWARALELRDKDTEGHSRRITDKTVQLASAMGITEPELTHIRRGALLHDIGKLGINDKILRKTGPLSNEEWVEMRKHPQYAYDWLHPIAYLRPALDIPYCHHEKWDGSGYPRGLKGRQIPLAARIFAVVDVYDALAYGRPYHAAWPRQGVLDYLHEQSGSHFDPQVVKTFLEILSEEEQPTQGEIEKITP